MCTMQQPLGNSLQKSGRMVDGFWDHISDWLQFVLEQGYRVPVYLFHVRLQATSLLRGKQKPKSMMAIQLPTQAPNTHLDLLPECAVVIESYSSSLCYSSEALQFKSLLRLQSTCQLFSVCPSVC